MVSDSLEDKLDFKYRSGWSDPEEFRKATSFGLNEDIVREISAEKEEPKWMLDFRLKSLNIFLKKPLPSWGSELLGSIDFDSIRYYVKYTDSPSKSWEDLPLNIKSTFDKLGIPQAERNFFAGVGAQYDSETVYHNLREDLEERGVVFLSMDDGLREHPDIVRKYFSRIIHPNDNKFSALNSAVWSGGSFVHVPEGVQVDTPLQAYFRINSKSVGQFERTLIIAEPGSKVHYIEGCTAPIYSKDSLHSAVVELVALQGSHLRYTTVQNWSNNIYNLVTKRAFAYKDSFVEWVDGNIGSKLTMKYPSVYLLEPGARGEVLSVAYAGCGQHQDTGAKMIHLAPNTLSKIVSKSISKDSGRTTYRGLVRVAKKAVGSVTSVSCDALLLDDVSQTDTYPYMEIEAEDCTVAHEATVGKISDDSLFYLQSRGIPESDALHLIVMGFLEPFAKELPIDYAIELNRLIELNMDGSVG